MREEQGRWTYVELPLLPMSSRCLAIASFDSHRSRLHAHRLTFLDSPPQLSSTSDRFYVPSEALQARRIAQGPLSLLRPHALDLQRRTALQHSPPSSCSPLTYTPASSSTSRYTSSSRRGIQYVLHRTILQILGHSPRSISHFASSLLRSITLISHSIQVGNVRFSHKTHIIQIGDSHGITILHLRLAQPWRFNIFYN